MGDLLSEVARAVAPHIVEALVGVVAVLSTWATAWVRAQAQRLAVEHATVEAEVAGTHRLAERGEKMPGAEKKALAIERVAAKLPRALRPGKRRLDTLIEAAVPRARRSVAPPE